MATRKASSTPKTASKVSKSTGAPKAPRKTAAKPAKKALAPTDPEEILARLCADGALDKKAEDVVILDMREISSFTDFFVVVSGTSEPQLKAIAGSIREKVREATGRRPTAEDGFPVSQWVIIDYGTVIVHVFHRDKRALYGLEDLWNDAKRIEIAS